ncbi:protein phosphatase Slingshot homolog 1 isoform X2 [Rhinoraja longicauda]
MALVTVQRSPTPSASSSPSVSEVGSDDDHRAQQSLSDSFFTVKGAALFLQQGSSSQVSRCHHHHKYAGDLQLHLQVMINHLRPEDRIKLAVRLESMSADRIRYMVVVYTNGHQDTEENVLLGIDFASKESNTCTIGMTLPLWSDTKIHLDGDGGFSVSTADRSLIFKPVSVQAMWSALQILHKSCEMARRYNYYPSGMALTWASYYESCINSEQSCINEWNTMQDLQSMRADSPSMFVDKPTESELTERLIRNKLRYIMMSKDLENVTSKEIRNELEQQMNCNLKEYKGFIDNEMLIILGQMDKASLIFDHLYLGSEWNASNLEELQATGVGYILNVTREIDNFFPGLFCYHNIRVFDEDSTDLLAYWNDTYNFITKAKKNHSKCLVHCKMGVSRSASTVIAYAMKEFRWSLEKAYKYVKEKRSVAQPNAGFMKQLAEYEGILDASKHRHNSLWRRNSESDLQETVRDPLFKSTRISTQHDVSSDNKGIQHRYGKQKYNGTEMTQNSIAANKNKSDQNNSNRYFRCLSDPIVDSAYIKQQREQDEYSIQVDDVERDAIQMNNRDFRCTDGFCDTGEFVSSQLHYTYEREEKVQSQQGNTYLMFTAVAESEEENENTLDFSVYADGVRIALDEPNTENDLEADSNFTNMQEPGITVTVEYHLDKDNVNNNNTTRIFLKVDEDVTTNEIPNSLKSLNKLTSDCSDSINQLVCEKLADHSENLYPAQKYGTSTTDTRLIESQPSGFISNVPSVVSPMDTLYEAKPCHATKSSIRSSSSDAIYAIETMQFHETAEAEFVLSTTCEEQGEQQETEGMYPNCKNEVDDCRAESLALYMIASQSGGYQVSKQSPVINSCSHDSQKCFFIDSSIHTGSKVDRQADYELNMLNSNYLSLGNEQDDITENIKSTFSLPSSRQSIEDNQDTAPSYNYETMNSKPMKDLEKLVSNQEKETSKVQSYLMQHQESILQLQKAGLVRKHTKELERLALRSPSKQVQRCNSQNRKAIFAHRDCLDMIMHEPVVDIQDQAQASENIEYDMLPEAISDGSNFMAGMYQKTSTPYVSHRSGSGFLTKERLQKIYATLFSSPHSSSLTRSSSSDSIHSIQGQPGLVELRTQEIEAKMHQTGLTICSEMKRSHSLAKLESLNLASEDLSAGTKNSQMFLSSRHAKRTEGCCLPSVVEKMRQERSLCEETDTQRELDFLQKPQNESMGTSSSALEYTGCKLADIQCTYQFEHSSLSSPKYSVGNPEITQQCMNFISIPSFGLDQYQTQSYNDLYTLVSHEQYVRTHSIRKRRKTCEKNGSSSSFYNTM